MVNLGLAYRSLESVRRAMWHVEAKDVAERNNEGGRSIYKRNVELHSGYRMVNTWSESTPLRRHVSALFGRSLLATALDGPIAILGLHVLEALDQGDFLLFG